MSKEYFTMEQGDEKLSWWKRIRLAGCRRYGFHDPVEQLPIRNVFRSHEYERRAKCRICGYEGKLDSAGNLI